MSPFASRTVRQNNYRFFQGEFAITVVRDGFFVITRAAISRPRRTPQKSEPNSGSPQGTKAGLVESKTHHPIISKGNDLIIVDIVCLLMMGPEISTSRPAGRLAANLIACGHLDTAPSRKCVHARASRSCLGNPMRTVA